MEPIKKVEGTIEQASDNGIDFVDSLIEKIEEPVNNIKERAAGAITEVSGYAVKGINSASKAMTLLPDTLKLLNDNTSIALNSQVALGIALPPVLPMKELGLPGIMPKQFQNEMRFYLGENEENGFTLPIDPLISINGGNNIIRRMPLKCIKSDEYIFKKGTVKEFWSQGDYYLEIKGTLYAENQHELNALIKKLVEYCETEGQINVICKVLNSAYNIHSLAIEKYEFPFTQGEEYQNFILKAYSDNSHELLENA